jgi:hypothetical protein
MVNALRRFAGGSGKWKTPCHLRAVCCRGWMPRHRCGRGRNSMPGFARGPQWQGRAAETGAIARRPDVAAGSAFAARWLARLEELRDWATGIEKVGAGGTASAAQAASGRGRALVETARGLLMHEIALDGERIADYFIVAPTEWNFHPQGPIAGWLKGRDAGNREALNAFAARAVAALDPCVRWELEWL